MHNIPDPAAPVAAADTLNLDRIGPWFDILSNLGETSIEPGTAAAALAPLGVLPPFLHSLLVTDGTVTMALEAYFAEPIRIHTLWQGEYQSPCDIASLKMKTDNACFVRHVELLGTRTEVCYAKATSLMNPEFIEPVLFSKLVDERIGIGVILRNDARGSFREVLQVQRGNIVSEFAVNRTYRVSLNAAPALLITEEFPLAPFA